MHNLYSRLRIATFTVTSWSEVVMGKLVHASAAVLLGLGAASPSPTLAQDVPGAGQSAMSIPSGFGGEHGLVQLAPDRVLFSNGRIGTGAGAEIGRGETDRALSLVQRSAGGWSVCGLQQIDRGYFGHGQGRLLCLAFEDSSERPTERVLGDRTFSQPLDLVVGDRSLVMARDGQGHLTAFRFGREGDSEGWRLPDPAAAKVGFIIDQNRVAAVYQDGEGCRLRTFRLSAGGQAEITEREADAQLCRFHEFKLLRGADGAGAWLYGWDATKAALYDIADGELVLVDTVRLSRPHVGPGPTAVVGGVIYFEAGPGPDRGSLIGVYDPQARRRRTVPAQGARQFEGPPDLSGLMPSPDGALHVLVRNGPWATYPFDSTAK